MKWQSGSETKLFTAMKLGWPQMFMEKTNQYLFTLDDVFSKLDTIFKKERFRFFLKICQIFNKIG